MYQPKLSFKQVGDEDIEGAVREHVFNGDSLGLTHAVCAILRLKVIGRNPIEILKDHMGCGRQRDADAASDDIADRYTDLRVVLESVDGLHPLLGVV